MSNEQNSRLIQLFKNSGKSTKQISEEIEGIPYQTLANYSRGKRIPKSSDTWKLLADYFNVSVAFLMGVDDISKDELKIAEIKSLIENFGSKYSIKTDGISHDYLLGDSLAKLILTFERLEQSHKANESLHHLIQYTSLFTSEVEKQHRNIRKKYKDDFPLHDKNELLTKCENEKDIWTANLIRRVIEYIDSIANYDQLKNDINKEWDKSIQDIEAKHTRLKGDADETPEAHENKN